MLVPLLVFWVPDRPLSRPVMPLDSALFDATVPLPRALASDDEILLPVDAALLPDPARLDAALEPLPANCCRAVM